MLDENENPSLENEAEASPSPAAAPAVPAFDPRRRLRELLSIPDRDRTDAEWDELNELEIQTAPGNRAGGQPFASYSGGGKPGGGGGAPGKNRFKGKQRKPGSGSAPRPQQAKQHNNKPRPA